MDMREVIKRYNNDTLVKHYTERMSYLLGLHTGPVVFMNVLGNSSWVKYRYLSEWGKEYLEKEVEKFNEFLTEKYPELNLKFELPEIMPYE